MLDALFSDSGYRYRVGNDSKYLVTALNLMHESTQDAVWTYPSLKDPAPPCVCAEGWRQHGQVKVQERLEPVLMMAALGSWDTARVRM